MQQRNLQTKKQNSPKTKYPIMETFHSIQGEGYHTGSSAWFIRFAGCDVGCVWCDVQDSWEVAGYPLFSDKEIMDQIPNSNIQFAVVTGGEPLMYNLDAFTNQLRSEGIQLHLETSGAYPLSGHWDWICLSPKKFKKPLESILLQASELKIIVYNSSDFAWAESYAVLVNPSCKLFLQPEWSKSDTMLPEIIQFVHTHPQWRISLQTHKYLKVR